VVGFFYHHYKRIVQVWAGLTKQRDPTGTLYHQAYVNIWRNIPPSCLVDYFQSFNL